MNKALNRAAKSWAESVVERMPYCSNEHQVRQYLVEPFLEFLDYSVRNPNEVIPESAAGSAETPFGRADYGIKIDNEYIIAIECKSISKTLVDEQGQLKRYFEAMPTVKVGLLTNGIIFKFFTNSDQQHLMDGEPFAAIDAREIAEKGLSDFQTHLFSSLTRSTFDVSAVQEMAHLSLLKQRLKQWWFQQLQSPNDDLCKVALRAQGISYISKKMLETHRPIVVDAFRKSLSQDIWQALQINSSTTDSLPPTSEHADPRIITTEREIAIFHRTKVKLAHLGTSTGLPHEHISQLNYKDYVGHFSIYYSSIRNGHLFKYFEPDDSEPNTERYLFPDGTEYSRFEDIDQSLLQIYALRVAEMNEARLAS